MKQKTLKVSKNPRQFNLWDSSYFKDTAEKAAQIVYNIDGISEREGKFINELPSTTLPISLVYEICESYISLYEKLMKENLLKSGTPIKHNLNIH